MVVDYIDIDYFQNPNFDCIDYHLVVVAVDVDYFDLDLVIADVIVDVGVDFDCYQVVDFDADSDVDYYFDADYYFDFDSLVDYYFDSGFDFVLLLQHN